MDKFTIAGGRRLSGRAEVSGSKNAALPILADVRDESAETVRIVLEPKSRTVDAAMLMEQLFRQTELETRVSLNLNVLDTNNTPRVMNLREALQAFLDHRMDVLVRRTKHRLEKIEYRLEMLEGFLIAYLNLDKIINNSKIIDPNNKPSGTVQIGSKVKVLNQSRKRRDVYQILGSPEAAPSQGKISHVSPIGQALLGKHVGEGAVVKVPAGTVNLEVLEINL